MKRALTGGMAILMLSSLNVLAFEETRVLPKTTPEAAGAITAPQEFSPEFDLTGDGDLQPEEKGPTISLPGLGIIGTLPKLDFGLELLYNADDPDNLALDDAIDSDITIRGTVKHKF